MSVPFDIVKVEQASRRAAYQPARRGPDPAPRGSPAPVTTRGALPTTPMADRGVDLGRAPGQLQRGRLRGGRRPPSRARGRVRTLLLPRLNGGVDIAGDDLSTGSLSLRRVYRAPTT
ncbi:MAG: hypothetical protein JNM72_04370 [Deltaproteobacteria bacterium]|nr:hypothetical protein [Deltaproteobacteria bacterium]